MGVTNLNVKECNENIYAFPNAPYIPVNKRNQGYGKLLYKACIQALSLENIVEKNNVQNLFFCTHQYIIKTAGLSRSAARVYKSLVRDNTLIPIKNNLFTINNTQVNTNQFFISAF